MGGDEILHLQAAVRRVPVADHVYGYAERVVRCTRPNTPEALPLSNRWLTWGAGPRASLNLVLAAKAHAVVNGQNYVSCDDVAAITLPVMRHRLVPNFAAQSEGVTSDDITRKLLEYVPKYGRDEVAGYVIRCVPPLVNRCYSDCIGWLKSSERAGCS